MSVDSWLILVFFAIKSITDHCLHAVVSVTLCFECNSGDEDLFNMIYSFFPKYADLEKQRTVLLHC